jgi:chlorobactene glucosyltransferase
MIFPGLVLAETVFVVIYTALIVAFYALLRKVPKSDVAVKELPFVSVVVPARNEESKIARCLESLALQDYPNFEIVVIDDRSTDGTAEIIASLAQRFPNVKHVQGKENPDGWIGKCNALNQAMAHASGEWVIFTDADTCHEPNSIRDSVSYALMNKCDLISFVPVQELGSFWERLVMPVLLGSFLCGDPFHTVNNPANERAYAYGQYILVRRSTYQLVGGHQSVRDEIVEDHALARVFKTKGYRILVGDGKGLYTVRMYTDFHSLWHGWTKNLYSLIECRPGNLFLVLLGINCAVLLPFLEIVGLASKVADAFIAPTGAATELLGEMVILIAIQLFCLILTYRRTCDHHSGVDWRHFLLLPAGALAVTALYLSSAYHVFSGSQVNWKGRRYTVNSSKTIEGSRQAVLDSQLEKSFIPESSD